MNEKIIIKNKDSFNKKLSEFKKLGINSLHIVSDFDRTLTKTFIDGKKSSTSYDGIRNGNYFGEEYFKKDIELFDKYHPIEISIDIPLNDKIKAMEEWWDIHYNMVSSYGITTSMIKEIAKQNNMNLREGSKELFNFLEKHNIPMLIFSSGIGNVITEFLSQRKFLSENVHIISNFFTFDKNGKSNGYQKPLIHVFNKNEVIISNFSYNSEIEHRKNIILLGDSLGDLGMSEGMKYDNIIKIGFLNEKIKTNQKEYENRFDVIIVNDGTMNFVNELIKKIKNNN